MKIIIPLAMCVLLLALGCEESPQSPAPTANAPAPPPEQESAAVAEAPKPPAAQPQYALEIKASESDPRKYTVHWTATVPTGGWKLTTDSLLVEESMGATWARIYAILEAPAAGEAVTQTPETLTGEHDAGERQIDKAEYSIKRTTRGDTSVYAPMYVVVKQIGSW